MNVEICSSVAAVKYLYKYIYKGHDRVTMKLQKSNQFNQYTNPRKQRKKKKTNQKVINLDEVDRYRNGRWVGSCEAAWRLLKFKLHQSKPSVQALAVHTKDHQSIRFSENMAGFILLGILF